MNSKKYRSLGVDVTLSVPSTVEEFDQNAKKPGACLDEAINNCVYRGTLAEFRDAFCERVEKETSIERKVKTVGEGDKAKEVFAETEGDYLARVCVEKGWLEDKSTLQKWADEVSASLVFDASAPERKPAGPKTLAKMYKEKATELITSGRLQQKYPEWAAKLTGDATKDVEVLGWLIKAHVDAIAAAAKSAI